MSSSASNKFKVAAFALITGGHLVRSGLQRFKQARRVLNMSSISVASAPQGLVELQGFAWPSTPVRALLTQLPVVYYRYEVHQRQGSGNNVRWVHIHTEESDEPFFLADESGRALIYPEGATLEIRKSETITRHWGQLDEDQRAVLRLLVPVDAAIQNTFFNQNGVRVTERVILPGAPLYALGDFETLDRMPDLRPAVGLRAFLQRMKALKKKPLELQEFLDTDNDGRISFEEWYQGYARMAAASGSFDNAPVVLPSGMQDNSRCFGAIFHHTENPLYLADCHQAELIERIGSYNPLRIVGGALLIAFGITLLFW